MSIRITPEQKELLEAAAQISGRSVSDIVTEAARERALQIVRDDQDFVVWKLAGEDARAFAEALSGPPVPNPRFEAAYAKSRRLRDLLHSPAGDTDGPND